MLRYKRYFCALFIFNYIAIVFLFPLMALATLLYHLGYGETVWLRTKRATHKVKHWSLIRKAKERNKYVWS